VAEAEPAELDAFVAAIQREMSPFIQDVVAEPDPPGARPMTGFSIRP
jgi:hypothetical protein